MWAERAPGVGSVFSTALPLATSEIHMSWYSRASQFLPRIAFLSMSGMRMWHMRGENHRRKVRAANHRRAKMVIHPRMLG